MTFIPNILSTVDNNNSTSNFNLGIGASYIGNFSLTTGFNAINLVINSSKDSSAGGIQITFADTSAGTNPITYTDSYFSKDQNYNKTYSIPKAYYRLTYINGATATTGSITSRLETNSQNVAKIDNVYTNLQSGEYDAFAKLRVSNPFTLIDVQIPGYTGTSEYRNNNLTIAYKSITGAAPSSSTSVANYGYVTMSGTGVFEQINQSRTYCNYQPGKSLLFLASGQLKPSFIGGSGSNIFGRIGFFDDVNGLYFESDASTPPNVYVAIKNGGGSPLKIPQNSWNIDKMDGSGNSGFNINFSKMNLFVLDFEWLGVGRIRFGFYISGKIYYCHQIDNVNDLDGPYIRSANLPVRYSLQSTDISTGNATMIQVCATIISEGGYNPVGYPFAISNGNNAIELTSDTNFFAVLALSGVNRIAGRNYNHENIIPSNLSLVDSANSNILVLYRIRLILSPASLLFSAGGLTGGVWNTVSDYSIASYATFDAGSIVNNSNFIVVQEDYFYGKGNISLVNLSTIFNNYTQLNGDYDNNVDVLLIEARRTATGGTSPKVLGQISWQELY